MTPKRHFEINWPLKPEIMRTTWTKFQMNWKNKWKTISRIKRRNRKDEYFFIFIFLHTYYWAWINRVFVFEDPSWSHCPKIRMDEKTKISFRLAFSQLKIIINFHPKITSEIIVPKDMNKSFVNFYHQLFVLLWVMAVFLLQVG